MRELCLENTANGATESRNSAAQITTLKSLFKSQLLKHTKKNEAALLSELCPASDLFLFTASVPTLGLTQLLSLQMTPKGICMHSRAPVGMISPAGNDKDVANVDP